MSTNGTWWVGEQFQPDGSAIFAVINYTGTAGHPPPQANQVMFGPWASQKQAQSEIDSGKFRVDAKHAYYGKNVSKGPGGLSVPKNQGPTIPSLTDWGAVMLRIGEALLGLILIGVGLARITGAQNAVSTIVKARIP